MKLNLYRIALIVLIIVIFEQWTMIRTVDRQLENNINIYREMVSSQYNNNSVICVK